MLDQKLASVILTDISRKYVEFWWAAAVYVEFWWPAILGVTVMWR